MTPPAGPVGQLKGRAARLAQLLPAGGSSAARTPFVLLVVLLLAGGLIALLVLNSALNEGSFRLSKLKDQTTGLTDEQQALERDVDGSEAPASLARRAHELGMVPGGNPVFLAPDGRVLGVPQQAAAPPSPSPSVVPSPESVAAAGPPPQPAAGTQGAAGTPSAGASALLPDTGVQLLPDSGTGVPSAPSAWPQSSTLPGR